MSHTTHWAFDRGIFTISDQYEVLVHPKAKHSDHKDFKIFGLTGKKIILPDDESRLPHQDALLWHKEEVFGSFQR